MDERDAGLGIMAALFIMVVLFFLSQPNTGNIAGYEVTMPNIGWMGFGVFAVIALFLFFKHRA